MLANFADNFCCITKMHIRFDGNFASRFSAIIMNVTDMTPMFFEFIENHANEDSSKLLLKYNGKTRDFDLKFALTQIECRKKGAVKLKNFISNPGMLFPDSLAYEQSSHEAVAMFHSSLAGSSHSVLDMTAGLGIDAMAFANKCASVTACEINATKADVLAHNSQASGLDNFTVLNADSVEWLKSNDTRFNTIFIDPARRDCHNGRVYNFRDCLPDVVTLQDFLTCRCDTLLIKASPLLDISATLKDIHCVKSIRAVSVNGECKEILIEASSGKLKTNADNDSGESLSGTIADCKILKEAIDLNNDGDIVSRFSFQSNLNSSNVNYASFAGFGSDDTGDGKMDNRQYSYRYLYEPNAPMMKLSPWGELCDRMRGLHKLDPSSHLFVSDSYIAEFPGRILKIDRAIGKKHAKEIQGSHLNVVSRNYPLSPDEIRKKYSLKEGSDKFLYATRIASKPIMILAEKIQ